MKSIKAILLALALSVSVTACSTTDLIKAATSVVGVSTEKPMVGIDTEIGDDQLNTGTSTQTEFDDVEGDVQVNNNNQKPSKNVNNTEQVTFNESMSPFAILLIAFLAMFGALGWMLPSWAEMRSNVKGKKQ